MAIGLGMIIPPKIGDQGIATVAAWAREVGLDALDLPVLATFLIRSTEMSDMRPAHALSTVCQRARPSAPLGARSTCSVDHRMHVYAVAYAAARVPLLQTAIVLYDRAARGLRR